MQNGTIFQYFHWYLSNDGTLWKKITGEAPRLAEMGFTAIWLPPACKGTNGGYSIGYDIYDLYDLGEFDQKNSVRTKYGTRQEYIDAIKAIHAAGMQVYVDIVLNHKAGGDEVELIKVRKVDPEDRTKFVSEPIDIEAYTKFTFPGRKGKYSDFIWDFRCFTGVDFDNKTKETAIYSILNDYGEGWEEVIDEEKGNYDYLMYDDIEFRNRAVVDELKRWGEWYCETTGFDGVRLDAVKHISPGFENEWLDHMRKVTGKEFFAVGEYWAPGNLPLLLKYIEATEGRMSLFDASLHHNLEAAGKQGRDYDLTTIFNDTLVAVRPDLAVTVVGNHDTQPLQSLEAPVQDWFKPLAYALILLKETGYPCVFFPDMYGAKYTDKGHDGKDYEIYLPGVENIEKLVQARKRFAYGAQRDYADYANCIGWTREGDEEHPGSGCAVLLSNGDDGFKMMEIGKAHAGKTFVDWLGKHPAKVTIDAEGKGEFHVGGNSVSVWIEEGAAG
ncbi:alpha-amylase [Puia sp.]|uniref:alpha-amylase n=1 Tax=Puia sp. TaxID=2045100 RepID=UPI002F3F5751